MQGAEIVPLHCSLGDSVRLRLKRRKRKEIRSMNSRAPGHSGQSQARVRVPTPRPRLILNPPTRDAFSTLASGFT